MTGTASFQSIRQALHSRLCYMISSVVKVPTKNCSLLKNEIL
ncbi:hypothetical protein HMPREF0663_10284 [Hoylesella oralis ATCC 33269]|uniref:Uncharacterized protein n=1 Tax=Hoylesella oralis ATCC 33269 TaxID=873533 RepID=E7RMD4_9BACT|nr:hypothetical protein HMPREF0663_10284 [Hoylesella oralis ATCC 33269]